MDPAAAAAALGLGALRGPAEALKRDEHSPVWRLDTDSGTWVVKATVPHGDYWHADVAQTGRLEAAAWRAGVDMAEPLVPAGAASGLWVAVGGGAYARAARFLDGRHAPAPVPPRLAAWAGATFAALERLAVAPDPSGAGDYASRFHPESDWDEWLGQARDLGVLDTAQAGALKDAAMRIAALGEAAEKPAEVVVHGDFSHLNIMVTPEGPKLIDFDSGGPNVPWWELVAIAVEMGAPALGVMEPDRASVEACVAGYAAAGGTPGPADESAFTGILTGRLASTAWQLWMACGHRGGSAAQRAQFGRDVRASVTALTTMLEAVPTWAAWLKG
ncbi:aminoglycoside phosphotransferase family protein [Glycomyces terrestris]|nr:aminoglycoside phosphotransferase family protein [Glycomyces terrestris]